jgi:hypothetical protein
MQSKWRNTLLSCIILIGLVGALALVTSVLVANAAGVIGPLITQEADGNRREVQAAAEIDQPTISFIDSPSATCYQPDPSQNTCYIQWNYLYVTASTSQYIISMSVSLNNRLVAYHSGFFQTSMYIPSDMFGRGFKVACGPHDASGLGNSYPYTLRALETGGLGATNFGSVTCPGVYLAYLPLIKR